MTTGLHTVADIHCTSCMHIVGWKYELAFEQSQKYKEGKFILERCVPEFHWRLPPAKTCPCAGRC